MARVKQAKKKRRARPPRRLLALRKRLRKQPRILAPVTFRSASGVLMYSVSLRAGSPHLGFFKRKVAEEYRRIARDWRPLHSRTGVR